MTNLADLLPAGGGQNNTDFVADGTITSGAPVVLTAAGKAAAITASTTAAAVQTQVNFYSSAVGNTNLVWDSTNSKAVVFYNRSSLTYCKVGSLSGSTLTWGTETSVIAGATSQNSVCFDSTGNKIIYMYEDGTGTYYTKAIVGEISGSSISFGSSSTVWGNANNGFYAVTYDSTNDRIVFAARIYSTYYGKAKVASLSGTTLTYGTEVTFESANTDSIGMCFDSTAGKVLIVYRDNGNSYYGTAVVGTVSGTSISFGTPAVYNSSDSSINQAAHDPTANKNLIAYYGSTPGYSFGVVATISGTSVTFGTPVNSSNSVTVSTNWDRAPVVYNAEIKKPVFLYQEGASPYNLKYSIGTITGTAIAFSDHTTIGPYAKRYPAAVYDPATKQMITAFRSDSPDEGQSYVFNQEYTTTNLTSTNLLGLAPEAISDTATGTINTWGSRCENSSFLGTGISLGATSTVEAVDPLGLWANGLNIYDSTNNKHIIVYLDAGASNAGHGAVGTISGTTVSYGTPVVFQSQNLEYLGGAYDSTNEKVLVCYRGYDTGQNFYLYGVVGTVSGTSISWGTPAALNSTASYMATQGVQFDSNTGKFLVCYQDGGSSSNAAALVATVSGTSVSAGTPVSFDSTGSTTNHCVSYDANAQKFLVTWTRQSNYYAYAAVATISGTSVSFGSTLNWYTGSSYYQRVNYDANAQKHLSVYTLSNANGLAAAVATISGTSVTYGSATNILDDTIDASEPQQTYDSTAQQMLIFVNVGNSSPYPLTQYTATISGTSVTVSSGTTLLSGNNYLIGQSTYNPSANKTLVLWELSGTSLDSAVGTLGDLDLTVTSDYYVQTDGSLSTDTGGQLIGKAIKTNQINIKDYTG